MAKYVFHGDKELKVCRVNNCSESAVVLEAEWRPSSSDGFEIHIGPKCDHHRGETFGYLTETGTGGGRCVWELG